MIDSIDLDVEELPVEMIKAYSVNHETDPAPVAGPPKTLEITENGDYDVLPYQVANVNVSGGGQIDYSIAHVTNSSSGRIIFLNSTKFNTDGSVKRASAGISPGASVDIFYSPMLTYSETSSGVSDNKLLVRNTGSSLEFSSPTTGVAVYNDGEIVVGSTRYTMLSVKFTNGALLDEHTEFSLTVTDAT